jgi:hypothetical protein
VEKFRQSPAATQSCGVADLIPGKKTKARIAPDVRPPYQKAEIIALSFERLDRGLSDQAAAYSGVVTCGKALEAEY